MGTKRTFTVGILTLAAMAMAACSYSQPAASGGAGSAPSASPVVIQARTDPQLGRILTDAAGRTVYKYDADTSGASNCAGNCAQNWPPVTLPSGEPKATPDVKGTLGVLTRGDGNRQVMYEGTPLYLFVQDQQPADTKGEGVGGVWHVVHPAA